MDEEEESVAREHPGGIDFSTIFEEPEGELLKEISLKFTWQNHQLREKAVEGQDFLLVDTAVFETLFSTYGAKGEKANFKDFTRFGKEQEDGECVVELRLKKLQLLAFPDKTKFKHPDPWTIYAAKSETVRDLELKIKRGLGFYYMSKSRDNPITVSQFRLWKCNTEDRDEILSWDSKMAYTQAKINAEPVNIKEEDKKKRIDDLNFIDGTVFIVETPKKDGDYCFRPMNEPEEEESAFVEDQQPAVNEPTFNMDKMLTADLSSLLGKGNMGVTGLQNLGNTCFMNSGLQCLSNTHELTRYFLFGYYKKETNKDNPLGMKGKLAVAYNKLLYDMWAGKSRHTAPWDLKKTLGSKINRFAGYN